MKLSFSPMIVYPSTSYSIPQIQYNIKKIYSAILDRAPSAVELAQWTTAIKNSVYAYRDLEKTIYASEEYIQALAGKGVITTAVQEEIVKIKDKPKAGVFAVVSAGVLWALSLI